MHLSKKVVARPVPLAVGGGERASLPRQERRSLRGSFIAAYGNYSNFAKRPRIVRQPIKHFISVYGEAVNVRGDLNSFPALQCQNNELRFSYLTEFLLI